MKLRNLRRIQSRRWDSVHKSWEAVLDHEYMWPMRYIRPCKSYSAWCSDCNMVRFALTYNRFARDVYEFYDYEQRMQDAEGVTP
jgi:hypothetical protein